ncbi:MAG TPA: OsmC family protein [Solirubrobacteraceae bacterium]|nr:OsmC family protein [Solirubrobacteraceae bacterium]
MRSTPTSRTPTCSSASTTTTRTPTPGSREGSTPPRRPRRTPAQRAHAHGRRQAGPRAVDAGGHGRPGGDGTNPEQLFAAGYAACFANAMRSVPRRAGDESAVGGATVTARVDIKAIGGGRFGRAVRLDASVPKLPRRRRRSSSGAHERWPHSNATQGNIDVGIEVRGGAGASGFG